MNGSNNHKQTYPLPRANVELMEQHALKGETALLEDTVMSLFNRDKYFDNEQIKVITFFMEYSLLGHKGQKRQTKRPYAGHCIDTSLVIKSVYERKEDPTIEYLVVEDDMPAKSVEVPIEQILQGSELSYLDIVGGFIHDLPEDTDIKPTDIKKAFVDFVNNCDAIKNKEMFLKDAEGIMYIAEQMKKKGTYKEYLLNMIRTPRKMGKYAINVLKIKCGDNIANVTEMEDTYRDIPTKIIRGIRNGLVGILGEQSQSKKKISIAKHKFTDNIRDKYARLIEQSGKKFKTLSHWADRKKAVKTPQRLFNIYKSFRVVDTINQYMNRQGFDFYVSALKEEVIKRTLKRIAVEKEHLLKYHCKGFNVGGGFLDFTDRKLYSQYGRIIAPIKQIDSDWLEKEAKDRKMDPDTLNKIDRVRELYLTKNFSEAFDVLDKIYLDYQLEATVRSGGLGKKTKPKDERTHPYDLIEKYFERLDARGKEGKKEAKVVKEQIKGNHRLQYRILNSFERMLIMYWQDVYNDKSMTKRKMIPKGRANMSPNSTRHYRTFSE
ncbi:hypothetical protein ISS09_00885 [Candidatus Woesearchaeota archaeon]|nr:hypothetical protein [Candidatus Woesearchaeota archaeon]